MNKAGNNIDKVKQKRTEYCFLGIIGLVLILVNVLAYTTQSDNISSMIPVIVLDGIIILSYILCTALAKHMPSKKRTVIRSILLFAITPILFFILIEMTVGNITTISIEYMVKNVLCLLVIYGILIIVIGRVNIASGVFGILSIIVSLVGYYVMEFRGRVFSLFDLISIQTAQTVVESYTFGLPVPIALCIQVALLYFVVVYHFQKINLSASRWLKGVRIIGAVAVVTICGWAVRGKFSEELNMWDINSNYQTKGMLYTLLCELQYINVDAPEQYSVKNVESLETEIVVEDDADVTSPENLIVIMNESLADWSIINEVKTDEEIMPFINSMTDNTEKGWLHVPVFGAGTSDSEWEVLTGNTKQFLPGSSNVYQLYCNDEVSGLAGTLKEQGYYTVALHPFLGENWNRTAVYSQMGFDEFISEENWGEETEILRWCTSDSSAYKKIKTVIEEKPENQKIFTFLVTMQNHGGYGEETVTDGFESTVSLEYSEPYPDAEMYLSLINESDKAFEELVDYFSEIDELTMIVMFGDHLPQIGNDFYDELFGKETDNLELIERQKLYTVPYIIWTNYEMENSEAETEMSANYFGSYILQLAGLQYTKYNQFLLDMKEQIPIIGLGTVCDSNGIWYNWNELPEEYEKLLNQYNILQYNNMFDTNHRIDAMFFDIEKDIE